MVDQGVHQRRGGLFVLSLVVLALFASVRAGTEVLTPHAIENVTWPLWQPRAIAVHQGNARFSLPTTMASSRTLVIVSALAKSGRSFPMRLSARATTQAIEPELVPEPLRNTAKLQAPALPPIPDPVDRMPPRVRTFHLLVREGDVTSVSNYQALRGELRAVGERIQVYVDDHDLPVVKPDVLRDLVATFDDQIFPKAATSLGMAYDSDGDGRFTVFMTSWLTRLGGGKHAVDGFVRSADLDMRCAAPYSNHGDMMYLSTALTAGPHLRTVLAHEYTHAIAFSTPARLASHGVEEEDWLDEGLAHLAEDLHDFSRSNLDYRVSAFLTNPERYRLVVEDYYADDLFRSHGNRGATYLFLRWCLDRFGPQLLPALLHSNLRGAASLEAATGLPFAELYREWSTALFLSGLEPEPRLDRSYRTLNLRAPFDDWELAGPRPVSVTPGGVPNAWEAYGTTSHYVVVEGATTGAVEIQITGVPEAEMQVTAVRLPDDLAGVELSVDWQPSGSQEVQVTSRVSERRGSAVRLSSLSWEPVVPAVDPHSAPYRRGGIDMLGIASRFGTSALPAGGRLQSRPIALPSAASRTGPLIFKVVGTDDQGRRIAGWAELPMAAPPQAAGLEDEVLTR